MAESGLWNCDPEFLDRGESLLAYSGEATVREVLQEECASVQQHRSRMGRVDLPRLHNERDGFRNRCGGANIQLPDRHCGKSIRELVHIWHCGGFLAV